MTHTRRPESRRTTSSSGTSISSAAVTRRPTLASCFVERRGLLERAREAVEDEAVAGVLLVAGAPPAIATIRSSGTSSPAFMYSFACLPSSVPSLTFARSMSPVAMYGSWKSACSRSA